MRLHFEFSTPVARTDLDDYVRNLEITIGCYDEDCLHEYTVGKLAMDQILWADASWTAFPSSRFATTIPRVCTKSTPF